MELGVKIIDLCDHLEIIFCQGINTQGILAVLRFLSVVIHAHKQGHITLAADSDC